MRTGEWNMQLLHKADKVDNLMAEIQKIRIDTM